MKHSRRRHGKPVWIVITGAAVIVLAAVAVAVGRHEKSPSAVRPLPVDLPHGPESYLGVYAAQAPHSYAGVTSFTNATGVTPNVTMYYSGWYEPFQVGFARSAAEHGAVPLVQIDPTNVSLAKIASGEYDGYLSSYAAAVRSYRHPVILSFGHEMNGNWYSWGHQRASPAAFVAAWRHIVTVFRAIGASNVTWLWTVNIIDRRNGSIPVPSRWWPGSSYVTWVGIDGYYLKSPWKFAPLFGPTIAAVRELTRDPILIAETGAAPAAGKPAKIADLYAGIRAYGLLGFVWFDGIGVDDWRINSPEAFAALRRGAKAYESPAS